MTQRTPRARYVNYTTCAAGNRAVEQRNLYCATTIIVEVRVMMRASCRSRLKYGSQSVGVWAELAIYPYFMVYPKADLPSLNKMTLSLEHQARANAHDTSIAGVL